MVAIGSLYQLFRTKMSTFRGFSRILRIKWDWDVMLFPVVVDNVKEMSFLVGSTASIWAFVKDSMVTDYRRELGYLPIDGPSIYVIPLSRIRDVEEYFHTAVFLQPVDKFSRPEAILFDVYRMLYWRGYIQVLHFIPGGKEDIWNEKIDGYSIKIASILKKVGFVLSDARVLSVADGLFVKVEGKKAENISDNDIAY